jgi:hypothetical protein
VYLNFQNLWSNWSNLLSLFSLQSTAEKLLLKLLNANTPGQGQDPQETEQDPTPSSNGAAGLDKQALLAACLYLACRQHKVPRLLEEISLPLCIDTHSLQRVEAVIVKRLQLPALLIPIIDAKSIMNRMVSLINPWSPIQACTGSANGIGINTFPYTQQCLSICDEISRLSLLEGTPPQCIVAAVIVWVIWLNYDQFSVYLYHQTAVTVPGTTSSPVTIYPVNIDRFCQACHVTLSQIKTTIDKLSKVIDLLIPVSLQSRLERLYGLPVNHSHQEITWKRRCLSTFTPSLVDKLIVEGKGIGIPPIFAAAKGTVKTTVVAASTKVVSTVSPASNTLSPSEWTTIPETSSSYSPSMTSIPRVSSGSSTGSGLGMGQQAGMTGRGTGVLGKRFKPFTAEETAKCLAERRKAMLEAREKEMEERKRRESAMAMARALKAPEQAEKSDQNLKEEPHSVID